MTSDLSGQLQLQSNGLAVTVPAVAGTMMVSGNMPAFKAYLNVNQSLTTTTFTKVTLNTKVFDTNNNFDSTTNYRFTPTVAGYYKISGNISIAASTGATRVLVLIYKNGAAVAQCDGYPLTGGGGSTISVDVQMNGSTDYLELYAYVTATSPILYGLNESLCFMSGSMTRTS
jgi:hypothetical protein